ncbi:MAG TPA: diphthine--ammonia ligase [Polyangiaceae bacterium]|nr:diphthine--ammonia ligase [Polyangiaceae bacterium]
MNSAVLWTGGKDSALALHRCAGSGVTALITFVPPDAQFQAHDLELMAWQARALGLPHRRIVVGFPYQEGYERALSELLASGIERVVTGDIARVDGQPNFISACAERVGMRVALPLWGVDRREHMHEIVALGFDVVLTFVREPWLDAAWVGRHLDEQALAELDDLRRLNGLDLAGENGEYHSMVLGGPGWHSALDVGGRTLSAPPQHRLEIASIATRAV